MKFDKKITNFNKLYTRSLVEVEKKNLWDIQMKSSVYVNFYYFSLNSFERKQSNNCKPIFHILILIWRVAF